MNRSGVFVRALVLSACACGGPATETRPEVPAVPVAAAPATDGSWRTAATPDGRTTCSFRVVGGASEPPRNEDFDLEVLVERDGRPLRGATLVVRGFMPDHGHGMVRRPREIPTGDGTFLVEGMLLHMRGHWQLFFDVHDGGEVASVQFDLEI